MTNKTNDYDHEITEKEFRIKFAESLKAIRTARGLTQRELGKLCGLPEKNAARMVQKWKYKETIPHAYNIRLLATALNIAADELLPK